MDSDYQFDTPGLGDLAFNHRPLRSPCIGCAAVHECRYRPLRTPCIQSAAAREENDYAFLRMRERSSPSSLPAAAPLMKSLQMRTLDATSSSAGGCLFVDGTLQCCSGDSVQHVRPNSKTLLGGEHHTASALSRWLGSTIAWRHHDAKKS